MSVNVIPFRAPSRAPAPKRTGPFLLKLYQGRLCRVLHVGKNLAWVEFLADAGHLCRRHVEPSELSDLSEDMREMVAVHAGEAPCETEPDGPGRAA